MEMWRFVCFKNYMGYHVEVTNIRFVGVTKYTVRRGHQIYVGYFRIE